MKNENRHQFLFGYNHTDGYQLLVCPTSDVRATLITHSEFDEQRSTRP